MDTSSPTPHLPKTIVETAIRWRLRLDDASDRPAMERHISRWCRQRPEHALAWHRVNELMQTFDDRLRGMPRPELALPVLQQAGVDLQRRRTLKMLGLAVVLGGPTAYAMQAQSPWRADYVTGTGDRQEVILADGSTLLLNTRSAVDVNYTANRRLLHLREGEVLVDSRSASATIDPRPLILQCRFGRCVTDQSRFLVREHPAYSYLYVEQGRVDVEAANGQHYRAGPGDAVGLDASGPTQVDTAVLAPTAWARGMLVVERMRLADFITELSRYRTGYVGYDHAVAELRLSGVFQLDKPTALLEELPHILPVRVVSRSRWWIRIEASA